VLATKIVSLINFKGGVGKTTSAVNIAANLATYHEKKVLLVDSDPQTNATVYVMHPQRYRSSCYDAKKTLVRIFEECGTRTKSYQIHDLIIEAVVERDNKRILPGLDLLPSDPRLIQAERWLTSVNSPFTILRKEIERVREEGYYDYIIIDCAPNLYALTKNCIIASDYYLVPVIPDFLSSVGLELLVSWIYDFGKEMEDVKATPIKLSGVFFTKYRTITRLHREMVASIQDRLINGIKAEDGSQIVAPGEAPAFESIVRDLIAAAEAADHNLPLCVYNPSSESAHDFRALTGEFVRRV